MTEPSADTPRQRALSFFAATLKEESRDKIIAGLADACSEPVTKFNGLTPAAVFTRCVMRDLEYSVIFIREADGAILLADGSSDPHNGHLSIRQPSLQDLIISLGEMVRFADNISSASRGAYLQAAKDLIASETSALAA